MTWKDEIKKKQDPLDGLPDDFNRCIGIVIRGLENSNLFEYIEKPMKGMTNSDLIKLLDELQETLDDLAEAGYDEGTPMEDAMYRERERQGDRYSMM